MDILVTMFCGDVADCLISHLDFLSSVQNKFSNNKTRLMAVDGLQKTLHENVFACVVLA